MTIMNKHNFFGQETSSTSSDRGAGGAFGVTGAYQRFHAHLYCIRMQLISRRNASDLEKKAFADAVATTFKGGGGGGKLSSTC